MKPIHITNDIIPVAGFKTRISKNLNEIRVTERPIIITQNGKPAVVPLSFLMILLNGFIKNH